MEDKLHNDGLEDFLRKSFEQYDDSPSDGLWDKIESDLAGQPVRPLATVRRWWIVAAAVLLALVVCQHFYYNNEMAQLSKKVEQNEAELRRLEQQKAAPQIPVEEVQPPGEINTDLNPTATNPPNFAGRTQPQGPQRMAGEKVFENNQNDEAKVGFDTEIPPIDKLENTPFFIETQRGGLVGVNGNSEIIQNSQLPSTPDFIDVLDLKELNSMAAGQQLPTMPPAFEQIIPAKPKGKFSIGVHHIEMNTRERISTLIQRPMPMNGRRIFDGRKTNQGHTRITGLVANYDTGGNWFVESGINLRAAEFTNLHRPALKFKDRVIPNGTPPGSQHEFDYSLNTTAGLVDIEVRAEQTDAGVVISEDDDIRMEISTKQTVEYVSLPFLVGHRFGHGRLRFELKAGFMANFLTKNDFKITKVSFLDTRFRGSNTVRPRGHGPNLKSTTFDLMAAAGLEYKIGNGWSASLSPTLLKSSSNRHLDRYIQSSSFSVGIDVGVGFKF